MSNIHQRYIAQIALLAHQVIKTYGNRALNENEPDWHALTPERKAQKCAGVEFALTTPDLTPEKLHTEWLDRMVAEGWRLGPTIDTPAKLHPSIRPWAMIPFEQQLKGELFLAVIGAVTYSENIPQSNQEEEMLSEHKQLQGHSQYPEGTMVPIADGVECDITGVVGGAWEATGLTIEQWNDLSQESIDTFVDTKLEQMRNTADAQKLMGATKEDFAPGTPQNPITDEQARATLAVDLGLPADATAEQVAAAKADFDKAREPTTPAELTGNLQQQHEAAKKAGEGGDESLV